MNNRLMLYDNDKDRQAIWATEKHYVASCSPRQYRVMSSTNNALRRMDGDGELMNELLQAIRFMCKTQGESYKK